MRIWSLHPKYLDSKGLIALWRETLLAKHVLEGKTKGYLNHPQLNRFKFFQHPIEAIDFYLSIVYQEAKKRNYHFDSTKFKTRSKSIKLTVTKGQLEYEWKHLLSKLEKRNIDHYFEISKSNDIDPHPLFIIVPGEIENWEVL